MRRRSLANFGTIGPARHTAQHGACLPAFWLVFSASQAPLSAATLCLAAALGLLGGVARRHRRHGCIVPSRLAEHSGSSSTHRRLDSPLSPSRQVCLASSPCYQGSFCLVARKSLSLFVGEGAGAVVHRSRLCAFDSVRCCCTHGSLWAFQVSPALPNGDSCLPRGVFVREVGRYNVSLAFSRRCCCCLSESLRCPVRGVSAVFAEECRWRYSSSLSSLALSRISQLPG